jgi:hypothetical protein
MAIVFFCRYEGPKVETKPNSETPNKARAKMLEHVKRAREKKRNARKIP